MPKLSTKPDRTAIDGTEYLGGYYSSGGVLVDVKFQLDNIRDWVVDYLDGNFSESASENPVDAADKSYLVDCQQDSGTPSLSNDQAALKWVDTSTLRIYVKISGTMYYTDCSLSNL